jgi:hypothetical protein
LCNGTKRTRIREQQSDLYVSSWQTATHPEPAGSRLWPVLIPAAVLALGLAGLPLTGGLLAKLALKAQLGEGVIGIFATLSTAGSALLMLHFLRCLVQTTPRDPATAAPTGLVRPWLIMAFTAVTVPWALYPTAGSGTLLDALALGTLWAALWPALIGGVLAVGLWRWAHRLPRVPEGDVVVVGEAAIRATAPGARRSSEPTAICDNGQWRVCRC